MSECDTIMLQFLPKTFNFLLDLLMLDSLFRTLTSFIQQYYVSCFNELITFQRTYFMFNQMQCTMHMYNIGLYCEFTCNNFINSQEH